MRPSAGILQLDKDEPTGLRRQPSTGRALPRGGVRRRANTDTVKLLMLGYRQELGREFTLFNCFGSSFTALSSLTALGGTYYIGLVYGGPVVMTWGWLVVTFFTFSMGISMAELASAYPTSGALYYWSYKLAPRRHRNLACWMTAWILTMGQAAFSASNFYTFVNLVSAAVSVQYGVEVSDLQHFAILVGMFVVIGVLNCGSARLTAFMITLGTMWHIVALAAFCVTLPLIAPARHSVKYVFTSWQPNYDINGISSPVYVTLVGLLMTQWTLTGYDGSAHLAEETFHAEVNVPRAILLTIAGVGITGYAFVLALTFVRIEPATLLDPNNETGGANVVLQILIEITKEAYGSVSGGVALFTIPIVGTFFCSYQSIANNSRMLYAFARDNGVPLSSYAKQVHPRTKAPVYGVLYMLFLTSLLATPMCFNSNVFPAVTSFAVVGCYLAYSLPVLCKLSTGRRDFLPGPFFLGPRLSYINNVISLLWVLTVTVLFTLPQYYPITLINMNWSGPILGLALAFSLGWYFFPIRGARTWFIGPRTNLGQFQDVLPSDATRKASGEQAKKAAAEAAEAAKAAAPETETGPGRPSAEMLAEAKAALDRMASCASVGGRGGPGGSVLQRLSRLSTSKSPRSGSITASGYVAAAGSCGGGDDEGQRMLARSPSLALGRGAPRMLLGGSSTGYHSSQVQGQRHSQDHSQGRSHQTQSIFSTSFVLQSQRSNLASPVRGSRTSGFNASKGRRQSALNLLDGPASCASHIALLLQGTSILDDIDPPDAEQQGGCREGPRDVRPSSTTEDALEAAGRGVGDCDRARQELAHSPPVQGLLDAWISCGRGGGGGGSSCGGGGGGMMLPPERVLGHLSRDRPSPLGRAAAAMAAATIATARGGGGGGSRLDVVAASSDGVRPPGPCNSCDTGSGGGGSGDGQLRTSDSTFVRSARARLRRASVSVLAILPHFLTPSGGPVPPGSGLAHRPAASASGMAPAPPLYRNMYGNDQHSTPRLSAQSRARQSSLGGMVLEDDAGGCSSSGGGGTVDAVLSRTVPLALQHRVVPTGYTSMHFTTLEEDDGARLSADRAVRQGRARRTSVCARVVVNGPPLPPRAAREAHAADLSAGGAVVAVASTSESGTAGGTAGGTGGREVGSDGRVPALHPSSG